MCAILSGSILLILYIFLLFGIVTPPVANPIARFGFPFAPVGNWLSPSGQMLAALSVIVYHVVRSYPWRLNEPVLINPCSSNFSRAVRTCLIDRYSNCSANSFCVAYIQCTPSFRFFPCFSLCLTQYAIFSYTMAAFTPTSVATFTSKWCFTPDQPLPYCILESGAA